MGKKMNTKKRTASGYIRVFVYILAAVLLLSMVGSVLAKYVYKKNVQISVEAHEFYFTSDYLTVDNKEYVLVPDTNQIEISLRNYENELTFSTTDISYRVFVNGTEVDTGSLMANAKSSDTVTITGFENGNTYEVVAIGNSGFEKTLKATFRVLSGNKAVYKSVENTDEYVILTVWTEALSGNVQIDFPTTLIPDNTEPVMADVQSTDGTFTDSINFTSTHSSYDYRFFKPTPADVSATDFTVTMGSYIATVKVPEK